MIRHMRLLFLLASAAAHAETRVIDLHSADPESLVPVVRPLLGPWETVSTFRQSLVVTASPETLDRISALVNDLDRPLRQLLVSARRATAPEASGSTGSGTATSTRSRDAIRQVRTLETMPLLLREGQLIALPAGGLLGPAVRWQRIGSDIALNARVSGEEVRLEVDLHREAPGDGAVRDGGLRSTLSGHLGEWIPLEPVDAGPEPGNKEGAISTRARTPARYEIRVELLP